MTQTTSELKDEGTRCPECDYNLTGAPGDRCPWCGWTIDRAELQSDRSPQRTLRRRFAGFLVFTSLRMFAEVL